MLSPQHMSVERFFDRDDPEKRFLLNKLLAMPDAEAALANFRACLTRINSSEVYRMFEESGFPVHVRTEQMTAEEALHAVENIFGLVKEEDA